MSDGQDIDRFVKDPSLLVDLCREVIDELDASNDDSDISEREAQLREIAKTIERLEKAGVSVPDVLRGEKTRLAASLAVHADSTQALGQLADELTNILKELKNRLGQGQTTGPVKTKGTQRLPAEVFQLPGTAGVCLYLPVRWRGRRIGAGHPWLQRQDGEGPTDRDRTIRAVASYRTQPGKD